MQPRGREEKFYTRKLAIGRLLAQQLRGLYNGIAHAGPFTSGLYFHIVTSIISEYNLYAVSIRPAAGCKYFLLFVRHFCFALLTGLLAARVGAQAGFATSRTLGLGFGIDFGFFMTLNTIAIGLNK